MRLALAALTIVGAVACAGVAQAYDGFEYLADSAAGWQSALCHEFDCFTWDGGVFDVSDELYAVQGSANWAHTYYFQQQNYNYCDQGSERAAYDYIRDAYYYGTGPDWNSGDFLEPDLINIAQQANNLTNSLDWQLNSYVWPCD